MTRAQVFSDTVCTLGEGPLWHPERKQLFWFDILSKTLLTRDADGEHSWRFDDCVSAAGWVDFDTLLMASENGLYRFDIPSGQRELVVPLEADMPVTRSNDGRADPWGGFWIGTMGFNAEPGAGAIYRFYRGELKQLFGDITISNAICFAPDRSCAYYTDTADGHILRQPLDQSDGWPVGGPEVFLDFSGEDFGPDGAVVDAEGCLWNAQWGAGRVARYAASGALLSSWPLPPAQTTCPAFGGPELTTLFVTSAAADSNDAQAGQTFCIATGITGQREYQVIL
ncbi:MAG: SMP-30/gluconolactonase/LRE family protein [Rhodobacteraceae bacterium]|nr:SMP-30/gluconolactonase/LRE family protein [Paracoccaceae bacterium]